MTKNHGCVSTCVFDKRDEAGLIGHRLFRQKPAGRVASSQCTHTAVGRERIKQ